MAYKKSNIKKQETHDRHDKRYMVTDHIEGTVNNKKILADRGNIIVLTETEYNIFKNKVLLIYED